VSGGRLSSIEHSYREVDAADDLKCFCHVIPFFISSPDSSMTTYVNVNTKCPPNTKSFSGGDHGPLTPFWCDFVVDRKKIMVY
jgi:hypothetical protein